MAVCFKLLLAKNNVRMIEKFHTGTSNAYLFFILSTCMEKQLCSENVTSKKGRGTHNSSCSARWTRMPLRTSYWGDLGFDRPGWDCILL